MEPWNRGYDYFLGYFSSGVDYTTFAPDTIDAYVVEGEAKPLRDLVEATTDGGIARTGAAWAAARNYTDGLFSRIAAHAAERGAAAGADGSSLFAHLAFQGPHDDLGSDGVGDSLLARARAAPDGRGAAAGAALGEISATRSRLRCRFARGLMATDGAFGEVYDALEAGGLLDAGAVIVVASDNGGYPCGAELRGSNAPLFGSKFHYSEGALRVPAFVYASRAGAAAGLLTDAARGATYAGLMHHADWLATFAALAGAPTDDDVELGGVDMWRALGAGAAAGDAASPRDEIVFALAEDYFAIRRGDYKLVWQVRNATSWWGDSDAAYGAEQAAQCNAGAVVGVLYDAEADPLERDALLEFDASGGGHGGHWVGNTSYTGVLAQLIGRASELRDVQLYVPRYPYGAVASTDTDATSAFGAWGGYVAPWGCATQ